MAPLHFLGLDCGQRRDDRRAGRCALALFGAAALRQQVGERRRRRLRAVLQFRQRGAEAAGLVVLDVQRLGERVERIGVVADAHHRGAPYVDARNHAGRGEPRRQAGAHQRGLAGAAFADDQQERNIARRRADVALRFGHALQLLDGARDFAVAAEIDRRVAGVERQQAAERRTLGLDRPDHAAVARHVLGDPLPQQPLDLLLEFVGVGETLVGPQILSVGRLEPALEERIQILALGAVFVRGLVGRRGLAKHIDVRTVALAAGVERGEHLEGGAARIALAGLHAGELFRQRAAEPRPENGDDEVGLCGRRDLALKTVVGAVDLAFPQYRLHAHAALERLVEPLRDKVDAVAFGPDVARRRNKDPHFADGFIAIHTQPQPNFRLARMTWCGVQGTVRRDAVLATPHAFDGNGPARVSLTVLSVRISVGNRAGVSLVVSARTPGLGAFDRAGTPGDAMFTRR